MPVLDRSVVFRMRSVLFTPRMLRSMARWETPSSDFCTSVKDQMVKLYKIDPSPPARAVMMALDIYAVSADLVDINLIAGENMTPEFLKKNPLHTVPVMEDGSLCIHDSAAIIIYLAETYGKDDSFYPKDPKQRAQINQMLFFNSSFLFFQLRNIMGPALKEGQRQLRDKQKNGIAEGYGYLEEFLTRNKFIAGSKMSIADVACYATASTQNTIIPIGAQYPNLQAWCKEMEKQSFCQKYNAPGLAAFKGLVGKLLDL